jgi:hypothetical protein
VPVVTPFELDKAFSAVTPRASRMADIVASVPLLTIRTISIDGTASITSCASSTPALLVRRSRAVRCHLAKCGDDLFIRMARIIGPHDPT